MALVASFVAGASSIVALTTFFVSAQVALPEWVRGRGLAIFLTVYFGALTLGSAVWGEVATVKGVPFALACGGRRRTLIGTALTWGWKLQGGAAQDLTPSLRWRAPSFAQPGRPTIRARSSSSRNIGSTRRTAHAFLAVMQDVSLERRRDGAYAWHMFEDPNEPGQDGRDLPHPFPLELKYRETRVTKADELIEDRAAQFLKSAGREPLFWSPIAPAHRRPASSPVRAARRA